MGALHVEAWRVRHKTLGTLYAATTDDSQWVKIGFTTDLPKRLRVLNNFSHYYRGTMTIAAAVFGTYADEQRIHRALNDLRANKRQSGPRELYPRSVLAHPVCRAIFGRAA